MAACYALLVNITCCSWHAYYLLHTALQHHLHHSLGLDEPLALCAHGVAQHERSGKTG
jgi:hypothetical protein